MHEDLRFWVDFESTGLDKKKHGIWEIAAFITVEGEIVDKLHIRCRPAVDDEITLAAFFNNNWGIPYRSPLLKEIELWDDALSKETKLEYITATLMTFPPPLHAKGALMAFLETWIDKFNKKDKAHLVAYNADFDAGFLREFWTKMGDKYFGSWFWSTPLDILQRAAFHLEPVRGELENMKQSTVAEYLGVNIETEQVHSALYDIGLTIEIDKTITARESKNVGGHK